MSMDRNDKRPQQQQRMNPANPAREQQQRKMEQGGINRNPQQHSGQPSVRNPNAAPSHSTSQGMGGRPQYSGQPRDKK